MLCGQQGWDICVRQSNSSKSLFKGADTYLFSSKSWYKTAIFSKLNLYRLVPYLYEILLFPPTLVKYGLGCN